MGAELIFLFTFLIVQVSCEQKNTLTFVIDDTSSMWDDIAQVKSAAKSIVDIVLNEKSSQIEDIVVVTFNDPGVAFRKRTRNADELKRSLGALRVHGGGDCPEMSLSGIKLALEESQSGSFIYVFTDASAKDHNKFDEIKALCQEKQSQIVFVLTGDCGNTDSEDYQVYYKIAAASNGQVFSISKGEVGQVLEYVKETIKGDRTVITSTVVPPSVWSYVHFNIDDKTEYALVSASGTNVKLSVLDQHKRAVQGYEVITWTKNVKVLKLIGLSPGAYQAMVFGSSDVNVMIFGRTDFNFEFGFSNKVEDSLKYTETQPTIGSETHLIISVKDDEHSVNIRNVEILDMNERVIAVLPLTKVGGNLYATDKFLPPNLMFKVAVTATARSTGKPIRRIANTPVEPIKPVVVAPEISDTEKHIKVKEDSTINIHCRVRKGKPKPHVTWYFKQQGAKHFGLVKGKTDEVLRVSNVVVSDAGHYKCIAENSAGRAEHTVQLEVEALPAFERSSTVIKTRQSANVVIQCKISKGNPPPTIKWQFKSSEKERFYSIDNTGEYLRIVNVQLGNSGFYKCEAKNAVGTAQQIIQVLVLVPPKIDKRNVHIITTEGSAVSLNCGNIVGNPTPTIRWLFRRLGTNTVQPLQAATGSNKIDIERVHLEDSGFYTCRVENEVGFDEHTMEVAVEAAPEIERSTPSVVRAKENATISVQCRVFKGFPKATITWWYKKANSIDYVTIPNNKEYLNLENIKLNDAGHYKCVAENTVGHTDQVVQVIVEAPPRIIFIPPNSPLYTGVEGDVVMRLPCTAVGYPEPTVSWIVDRAVVGTDESKTLYVENGVLYLKNPEKAHSTTNNSHSYECHALNALGEDHKSYEVYVSENADYDEPDEKYGEINKPYDINCALPYTDPKSVRWFYNSIYINKTGPSLHFDNPTQANDGNYTCRVSDMKGAASYSVEVLFGRPPSASRLLVDEEWDGDQVEITCKASQIPDGKYEWYYRGEKVKEGHSQELSIDLMGWGEYVCRITNPLGSLNITYNVYSEDCIIDRSLSKTKNLPLVLDMSSTWPSFTKMRQYQIVPKSDKFTLICQDESPQRISKTKSSSNSFTKFPNTKSITAVCDHQDIFLVEDIPYKLSELDCKEGVSSTVVPLQECLGKDTMMIKVGFNVNGFLDVYKSCMDTKKNVLLYTEVATTGADALGYINEPEGSCQNVADCCYESIQLVNAGDVSFGPAEKATLRESLNSVTYCKPSDVNTTSWHEIERQVRVESSRSRLIVWSGAINYTRVDKLLVPQYLWKVVKNLDTKEIVAVVHLNAQAQTPRLCKDVCQESSVFEVYGPRTYCCKLEEFKKVFNLPIAF